MLPEIVIQSGIYWFLAVGLWINLRVVRYADLAVENTMLASGMTACAVAGMGFSGLTGVAVAAGVAFAGACALAAFILLCWKGLRVHAIIVSLSLSYILYSLALQVFGAVRDGTGLPKLRADSQGVVAVFSGVILVSALMHAARRSRPGINLLAAAGNPHLADSLGMNTRFWQWVGLAFGTFLIMFSGILHSCYYTYVNIGDAVGFLLFGIFSAVLVANGLCPRVLGFPNGAAALGAAFVFQSVIAVSIYAGLPVNLTKGLMGALLIVAVAVLRFRRAAQPIIIG
jgi:ABC-type uncharacterized transport system permease subunit